MALRDLDAVLDIDADGDGQLTWAEVKVAWPRVAAYAHERIAVAGCPLQATGQALERRSDGQLQPVDALLLRAWPSAPCSDRV